MIRFSLPVFGVLIILAGQAPALPPSPAAADQESSRSRIDLKSYREVPALLADFGGWLLKREFTRQLIGMADGSAMSGKSGWWGPGQGRYNWKWLADRFDLDGDGKISRDEFDGDARLFQRLDRDGDGYITAEDFDWSPASAFLRQTQQAIMLFYALDGNSNGRISREEWDKLFERLAKDKGFITQDDMRGLFPKPAATKGPKVAGPSMKVLLYGQLTGELGSMMEGPGVNERAPDFKLATHDGKERYSLSQFRGKKPVVLIFGSFT